MDGLGAVEVESRTMAMALGVKCGSSQSAGVVLRVPADSLPQAGDYETSLIP